MALMTWIPRYLLADGFVEKNREMMIDDIISYGENIHPDVLKVMRGIPREDYVMDEFQHMAYADGPLPIGYGQTISQPFIVAYMTTLLELKKTDTVLEIGTGSGYQAAVLAKLAKKVYTIEVVEDLATLSQEKLSIFKNVEVLFGDGYKGWEEYAPFDKIILTAAPPEIPSPLIDQLAEGGILVAPIGPTHGAQQMIRLRKKNGEIIRENLIQVRFVPMVPL